MRTLAFLALAAGAAAGDTTGPVRRFDPRTLRLRVSLEYPQGVHAIAFSPNGRLLAVATEDTVRLVDAGSWKERRRIKGDGTVRSFAFAPDGRMLVLGSGRRRIRRVHFDHDEVDEWNWTGPPPDAIVWSADGRLVGLAGQQAARFINPGDGGALSSIDAHCAGPYGLAISADTTLKLMATEAGGVVCKKLDHERMVTFDAAARSVLLSPDATRVIAGCRDGRVRTWNISGERLVAERGGHGGPVHALAWSPAHTLTVSAGGRTVRFWRGAELEEVAVLRHPGPEIDGVAVSRDGRWLVTATTDGIVRVWGR